MSPVFGHGHLRLYLLKLLDESPKHGYELIQALSDRFGGTYSPSAGTIYPRLSKLEEEGLVSKTTDGRKTVYSITDAGRAELAARQGELDDIEAELTDQVRRLADEVRLGVNAAMKSLRADLASAARAARGTPDPGRTGQSARTGQPGNSGHTEPSATSAQSGSTDRRGGDFGARDQGAGAHDPANSGGAGQTVKGTTRAELLAADIAINEFRQKVRTELRTRGARSSVPEGTAAWLEQRLVELRAELSARI